jgi:hypothetical protein
VLKVRLDQLGFSALLERQDQQVLRAQKDHRVLLARLGRRDFREVWDSRVHLATLETLVSLELRVWLVRRELLVSLVVKETKVREVTPVHQVCQVNQVIKAILDLLDRQETLGFRELLVLPELVELQVTLVHREAQDSRVCKVLRVHWVWKEQLETLGFQEPVVELDTLAWWVRLETPDCQASLVKLVNRGSKEILGCLELVEPQDSEATTGHQEHLVWLDLRERREVMVRQA